MPDLHDALDPNLLALARALGRYQARLDMDRHATEQGTRTSDIRDEVFVSIDEASKRIEIEVHHGRDSKGSGFTGG